MYKKGYKADDDQPDDGAQLCAGEPVQGPGLPTQLVMAILLLLVIPQVICQKAVALLKGQLCGCASRDVFGGQ